MKSEVTFQGDMTPLVTWLFDS